MRWWKIKKRVFKRAKVNSTFGKDWYGEWVTGDKNRGEKNRKTEHFLIFNLPRDVKDQN